MIGRKLSFTGHLCQPVYSEHGQWTLVEVQTGKTRRISAHSTKGSEWAYATKESGDEAASSPKQWFNALVKYKCVIDRLVAQGQSGYRCSKLSRLKRTNHKGDSP